MDEDDERQTAEREHAEREQCENEAVDVWLIRNQCQEDIRRAEAAAADDGGWNAWFDTRFMNNMRPVLEAVGEEIGQSLDRERKQSRDELAREVDRLNHEAKQLFAIISELQVTIRALNRIDAAAKRGEDIALAPSGVH
jgi:hypothetical protein